MISYQYTLIRIYLVLVKFKILILVHLLSLSWFIIMRWNNTFLGGDGHFTVTIISSPAGTLVDGTNNTFDYPILSNITLTCNVTSDDKLPFNATSYQWNTTGCYNNPNFNSSNPKCFPHGHTTQSVTDDDVTAEDAGTITCTVTINGSNHISEPFTLRISGEQLCSSVLCNSICNVYHKQ